VIEEWPLLFLLLMITFFNETEIVIGDKIANGNSCDVFDIVEFRQLRHVREMLGDEEGFVRDFLARNVRHTKTLKPRYVIKVPKINSEGKISDLEAKRNALAIETYVLRSLRHPNIIKVIGLPIDHYQVKQCSSNMHFFRSSCSFLMMEKVHEVLKVRIEFWKRAYRRVTNPKLRMVIERRGLAQKHIFIEQLNTVVELASALEYLHNNKYLHGMLVPSNIGFSNSGNLVLFNFDHSVPPDSTILRILDVVYEVLGDLRYQCPSVIKGAKYKESSEVYSFSMIMYEILTLKQPFSSLSNEEYRDCIHQYGNFPQVSDDLPLGIQTLLSRCWNKDESKRPNMTDIHKILQQEMKWAANGRVAEDLATPLISYQTSSSSLLPSQILRFQQLVFDINQVHSSNKDACSSPFSRSKRAPLQTHRTRNIYKTPAA
jgi:serine/threonine protein kinase